MADNDITLVDSAVGAARPFRPRVRDRGDGVRENVNGLSNDSGQQINPATEDSVAPVRGMKVLTPSNDGMASWPSKLFRANITKAGDVSVILDDGSTEVMTLPIGYHVYPYRVQRVNLSGTTAVGSFAALI